MLIASLPLRLLRRFFVIVMLAAQAGVAMAQSAIDGFDPNVNGIVYAVVTQPDGKVLVGGQFTTFRGRDGYPYDRRNLARLNVDGSLDDTYNPEPDAAVRTLVLQADGRVLVGGEFKGFGQGGARVLRNSLARLDASGAVEAGFDPNIQMADGFPGAIVHALAIQPDGQLLVGGLFRSVQGSPRSYLARLSAAGALDASFDPTPNGAVYAIAFHIDNKIVVGGAFTSFWEGGAPEPSTRNRIARLNFNGVLDSEFNPNANNVVASLAVQRDGKIVLGGHFTTLTPPADGGTATTRGRIARLNPDGTVDTEFYPSFSGGVTTVAIAPEGGLFAAGNFTTVWTRGTGEVSRGFAARLNPDGTLDTAFQPTFNGIVNCVAFQADGKAVVGGYFTRVVPTGGTTALTRNHLARLDANGRVDSTFELASAGRILATAVQNDGRIVVGGSFTNLGGATRNYLARVGADGAVEAEYKPDFNDRVYAVAVQSDQRVIVGGAFTTVNGQTRNHIARLDAAGNVEAFDPNINGTVTAIVVQGDGKILVGGTFTTAQPNGATTSVTRSNILRLNTDGSLDTTFDPTANSTVATIVLQSDQKILLGGAFTTFTPGYTANTSSTVTSRSYLARLNTDGTLDTAFTPAVNARVATIALQSDGQIVIGGAFTLIQAVSATEPATRNRIARLKTDGTLDATFDPNASGTVYTIAQQPDGRLLIGGAFTSLQPNGESNWTGRKYVARLETNGTVDPTFNLDIGEEPGNYVDSLRVLAGGRILLGGNFLSLHPSNTPARVLRRHFVQLESSGAVVPGFDLSAGGAPSGRINALAVQGNGRVIAVGNFSDIGGAKSTNIARFDPEGAPDLSFDPALTTNGAVRAVAVRPNATATASQLPGFAWFERDARLRARFASAGLASQLRGQVDAIVEQEDGSVIIGGAFNDISNTINGNLLRYGPDGQRDTSFNVRLNGAVTAIALEANGNILIGGSFTTVNDTARSYLARLDRTGALDTTFDPVPNARVNSIVIEGGKILIGGAFTTLTPNGATTAVSRGYIARLESNGNVDTAYLPTANGAVNVMTLQPNGKLLVGGLFTTFQPNSATTLTSRQGVARLNTDGTVDEPFDPNPNGGVNAIAVQDDGKVLLGGSFTAFTPYAGTTTVTRNRLARVNADGTVDASFDPNPNSDVSSIVVMSDGTVVFGGSFTTVQPAGGTSSVRNFIARVLSNGAIDGTFNPDMNAAVSVIRVARDGNSLLVGGNFTELQANSVILVGGSFTTIGGIAAGNLAVLNNSGSINAGFQAGANGAVNALLSLADGRAIVAGAFTTLGGATRNRLARLNADTTLDTAYNPNVDGEVNAVALQSDGKVVVGGSFANIGGRAQANIARLNADGTPDTAFVASNTAVVRALAVQPDGRILVVTGTGATSSLSRLSGTGAPDGSAAVTSAGGSIESITLQADGRIIVGGTFTTLGGVARSRVARLASDLSVDASFNPAPNGAVTALAVQSDGRVLLAGNFSSVAGTSRYGLARVTTTESATQLLGVAADRSSVVWNRGGAAGEVVTATFTLSTDRANWTSLGDGQRVGTTSNWRLATNALPASGIFYIRVRGIAPSSSGTSSGLFESVREFNASQLVNPTSNGGVEGSDDIAVLSGEISDKFAREIAAAIAASGGGSNGGGGSDGGDIGTNGARLADLAVRTRVAGGQPLVMGFAVNGSAANAVLIRAVGPGLAQFGVAGTLAAPRIRLFSSSGALLLTQEGWNNDATLRTAFAQTGAFVLPTNSTDAAFVTTLATGSYTLQIDSRTGGEGTVLAEVYDAGNSTTPGRLVNLSSRGAVTGTDPLIGGFVVTGTVSKRVLVRAIGPGLTRFGVSGALTDPSVAVYNSAGQQVAVNEDWGSAAAAIATASAQSGAFALEAGSKDAAVIFTAAPGAYTVQVHSAGTGEALLEVYELP